MNLDLPSESSSFASSFLFWVMRRDSSTANTEIGETVSRFAFKIAFSVVMAVELRKTRAPSIAGTGNRFCAPGLALNHFSSSPSDGRYTLGSSGKTCRAPAGKIAAVPPIVFIFAMICKVPSSYMVEVSTLGCSPPASAV